MKTITFLLRAFGFENLQDLRVSTFGFVENKTVLIYSSIVSFFTMLINSIPSVFGVEIAFYIAYVYLDPSAYKDN